MIKKTIILIILVFPFFKSYSQKKDAEYYATKGHFEANRKKI
jgi:hypothetical protein